MCLYPGTGTIIKARVKRREPKSKEELKTFIMRKLCLNISRIPYFSIYEMCYKPDCIEERVEFNSSAVEET